MSKLGVLIARDFNTRIRGGAYILMTVLGVLLIVGLAFGPHIFSKIRDSFQSDAVELLVVDNTGYMYPLVAQVAEERGPAAEVRGELIDATGMPGVGDASFGKWAAQALADSGKDGILIIDEAGQDSYSPAAFTAVLYDTSNIILNDSIQNFLNTVVRRANADRLNLTLNEIALLWASAPMRLQQLTTGIAGEQASTKEVAEESKALSMVLAYFLLFVLYMALILYGNMIATGVAEEKSNRIMEIMVSTVRPIELMTGKIVGIGLLGLLQFGIWIATGLGLSVAWTVWDPQERVGCARSDLAPDGPSDLVWRVLRSGLYPLRNTVCCRRSERQQGRGRQPGVDHDSDAGGCRFLCRLLQLHQSEQLFVSGVLDDTMALTDGHVFSNHTRRSSGCRDSHVTSASGCCDNREYVGSCPDLQSRRVDVRQAARAQRDTEVRP